MFEQGLVDYELVTNSGAGADLHFNKPTTSRIIKAVMNSQSKTMLPRSFPGGCIRRLRRSDLPSFQAYRSIPELNRYQSLSPMSEVEALAFLVKMSEAPMFTPGQ